MMCVLLFLCRTGAVADVLAASVKFGPISLSLQRCFGLGSSTWNLLVASAADGSRLRSILLSHIDSLDIPRGDPSVPHTGVYKCERDVTRDDSNLAKSLGSISSGSGLRILALNNCAGLAASDLISVVMSILFPLLLIIMSPFWSSLIGDHMAYVVLRRCLIVMICDRFPWDRKDSYYR